MLVLTKMTANHNQQLVFILCQIRQWLVAVLLLQPLQANAQELHRLQFVQEDMSLLFEGGKLVQLAEIVLQPRAEQWLREQAGQLFAIEAGGTDRYGRQVAYVKRPDGTLLQSQLVASGRAMVMSHQVSEYTELLLAEETKKEAVDHHDAHRYMQQYRLVSGSVKGVTIKPRQAYLNFGEDWKRDFTIYIPTETLKKMDHEWLAALRGKKVTVRGWIHRYYGPRITLFEPAMMDVDAF